MNKSTKNAVRNQPRSRISLIPYPFSLSCSARARGGGEKRKLENEEFGISIIYFSFFFFTTNQEDKYKIWSGKASTDKTKQGILTTTRSLSQCLCFPCFQFSSLVDIRGPASWTVSFNTNTFLLRLKHRLTWASLNSRTTFRRIDFRA